MKKCSKCRESKSFSNFSKDKSRKDGHKDACKECVRKYRVATKEIRKAYSKNYREEHRDEISKYDREYYYSNREQINKKKKEYSEEHRDKINKRQRAYYSKHIEKIRSKVRKYKEEHREKGRAYSANRKATKLNQTPADADFKKIEMFYIEAKRLEASTGEKYHVDHILCLTKGGEHHQKNLQVITATENLEKGTTVPENLTKRQQDCYQKWVSKYQGSTI